MTEGVTTIVIDNGSGMCKAGFAGDSVPKSVFSSIVGRPQTPPITTGTEEKEVYIGDEAQEKRGILNLKYPIEHGIVTDWQDMELVWRHALFKELGAEEGMNAVLITEAILNPKQNREKMTEIMFDIFNVPAFYVAIPAVLSLYSIGRTNGIVVDSGDGVTQIVPILEGYAFPDAVQRIDFAGRDITNQLARLLTQRGHILNNSAEREIVRDIKEKLCFIALDFDEEMTKSMCSQEGERIYELPDGSNLTVNIGNERFEAPEALFTPSLIRLPCDGADQITYDSIMKCDTSMRKELFGNIVLSGGTTMHGGFAERLAKGVSDRAPPSLKIQVASPQNRKISAWIGGSILSSLSSFQQLLISKAEYEEVGTSSIYRKCF